MIRISQLKIRAGHTEEALVKKLLHLLHIKKEELLSYEIRRQSLDARKKPDIFYVYTIDVSVKREEAVFKSAAKKKGQADISICREKPYRFPEAGKETLPTRPVVVGSGPAGLFCAYFLAKAGYRPIVIEQGAPVRDRQKDVERFWEEGILNPNSNVQFGEGGAGAFSDGKLNTLVKDTDGRIRKVLEIFAAHGAPKEILYVNKPHIGTDILIGVVESMRNKMISLGAEFRFHTKMTDIITDAAASRLCGIQVQDLKEAGGQPVRLDTELLVLAPGHSARDTFRMLYELKIPMEAKSFAVGVRAEHPQTLINMSQYGMAEEGELGAASYKLTAKLCSGRGIYSFCMCPGGYVVNASSEEGRLAVNGMSYHARDSRNANSAIVVTVTPEDFGDEHPLAGIEFQQQLEEAAYQAGNGRIPVQRYGDFKDGRVGDGKGPQPCMKGAYTFTDLHSVLPEFLSQSIIEGMEKFNAKISGFSSPDTLLSAVESRTSSPVRIVRGNTLESTLAGLYPCGEGAGYAGGITSAAVDGMKTAEAIRRKYASFDNREDRLRKI